MDVRQLKYFIAVCDAGSFSAAAEKLFISQQGLSMAVLRLEKELSCTLLKRTTAGVELTEQGEYLLPRAKEIVAAVVACEGYFDELRRQKTHVEVACAYGVMGEFAGEAIQCFRTANPAYSVTVGEYPDLLCEQAVSDGQAEIGFAIGPVDSRTFEVRPLLSSGCSLIVPRDHPMAKRKSVKAADLKNLPIMVMNESFKLYHNLKDECRQAGFTPNVVFKAGEIAVIHKLVAAGQNVGISVNFVCQEMARPEVAAIPIESDGINWTVCAIRRKGEELSIPAAALWRHILRTCSDGKEGET